MDRSKVFYLIKTHTRIAESGTPAEDIDSVRKCFGSIASVGMKETYAALSVGHNPEIRVKLSEASDYQMERYAMVDSQVYAVLRVYYAGSGMELTLERTRDLEGKINAGT